MVRLLLDKGADPNAQTSTGVTPLYDAAQNADYETVKIMVDGGARVKTCVEIKKFTAPSC